VSTDNTFHLQKDCIATRLTYCDSLANDLKPQIKLIIDVIKIFYQYESTTNGIFFPGWTHQRGGLALVQQSCGQGKMRRCRHLVANENRRHLHQSNTLGSWIRNSSRYADVRNLTGYSIGEKVISHIYLFWKYILTGNIFCKGGGVERLSSYLI
jgi:hypothetical protein